jgi:cytochrome c oxidase subunit 2
MLIIELVKNLLYFGANDTASPYACVMTWLHQEVFFYLVVICIFVLILMCEIIWDFIYKIKNPIKIEELNFRRSIIEGIRYTHSSILEIFWTLLPSLVLLLIAFPSLDLLYTYDYIIGWNLCLKVLGHQWYWSYEIIGMLDIAI